MTTATDVGMEEGEGDGWFVLGEIPSKTHGKDTRKDRDPFELISYLSCESIGYWREASYLSAG
jgi:hypothetical protein